MRCNTISTVGNKGDLMFMTFDGAMNVDIFKAFIRRSSRRLAVR